MSNKTPMHVFMRSFAVILLYALPNFVFAKSFPHPNLIAPIRENQYIYGMGSLGPKIEVALNDKNKAFLERDSIVEGFYDLLKTVRDQKSFFTQQAAILFYLFPDKKYEQIVSIVVQVGAQHGFSWIPEVVENIEGVDNPESCDSISLINPSSAAGPFRRTEQNYQNCFVHSAVRAMDYLNYSHNSSQPMTSIIEAGMGIDGYRAKYRNGPRSSPLRDGGFEEDVVEYLQSNGGCSISNLDLKGKLGEASHFELMKTEWELRNVSVPDFPLISNTISRDEADQYMTSLQKWADVFANLTLLSKTVWQKAVQNSIEWPLSSSNSTQSLNALASLSNELKHSSKDGHFGTLIFRKAYCPNEKIKYWPADLKPLLRRSTETLAKADNERWNEIRMRIIQNFRASNPQPLMVSICDEVFKDPTDRSYSPDNCRLHAVLVTGMRYDQRVKQCSYQILNSWGDSSQSIHPAYEMESQWGTLWLPTDQFKNISEILVLKPGVP